MKHFLSFFLLQLILLGVYSFKCPAGSDQMPQEDVCMYSVAQPEFYIDASRRCAALGGIPAKIRNIYENSYLFAMLPKELDGQTPYIGVERKKNNTWTYADGSPLIYQNWALNEPNYINNSTVCAIMSPSTGQWLSAECTFARPFICSIDGDDFQCPDGWVYGGEEIDYCYFLQNFTYPDSVHWQGYNWTTAEANCHRMGAHLVSIHSKNESDFLQDLILSYVANLTDVAYDLSPCHRQWAWIGYSGNGTLGTGTWTDGSPVDYIQLEPITSTAYSMLCNDPSCGCLAWGCNPITTPFGRYLCKMPSKSRLLKEMEN